MHLIADGGDHALGGAADPPQDVDRRVVRHREQRRRHVAVEDQANPGTRVADLGHRLVVALAVEHHHHHVADVDLLALGDQAERLGQRAVEVEEVGDLGTAGDLLHVDDRARVEHRAALGQRDHRERARHAERGQARPLERIDRDVDLRWRAVADVLAVVEHRRLVLLALADHHDAVHRHRLEHVAHGVDRGLVGSLLVAAADHPSRGQRRRLGHPDEFEGQVPIHPDVLVIEAHGSPGGLRMVALCCARQTEPIRISTPPASPIHHP